MDDVDIKKLVRVLDARERNDISKLFVNSFSALIWTENDGYESLYSFDVTSPLSLHIKLLDLSLWDKDVIFKAVGLIYPKSANSKIVVSVNYFTDFDIPEPDIVDVLDLKRTTFPEIHNHIKKCQIKIADEDFDGAITNARALVETVCLYVLEKLGHPSPSAKGDLGKLYKLVSDKLKLSPGLHTDERFHKILSPITTILHGVAELRNAFSDAHGISVVNRTYAVDRRHALLIVNLSLTLSEYIFLSYEKNIPPI